MEKLFYKLNTANEKQINLHLEKCKEFFVPPLDQTVAIDEYANRIFKNSITFEAWVDQALVGLIAAYYNDFDKYVGYITNVSVDQSMKGQRVATVMMEHCIQYAKENYFKAIRLEVNQHNEAALQLYKKFNFIETDSKKDSILMELDISKI